MSNSLELQNVRHDKYHIDDYGIPYVSHDINQLNHMIEHLLAIKNQRYEDILLRMNTNTFDKCNLNDNVNIDINDFCNDFEIIGFYKLCIK